jgi:hypothetical protein
MSLYMFFAVLAVLPPTDPIALEDRLFMPYADLLQPATYSPDAFRNLRSRIEHERDEKLEAAKKTEKQWKRQLDASRAELEELNRLRSVDTPGGRLRREQLHVDIAALERGIQEKNAEHGISIPAEYDKLLTKLWLIEHWPEERQEILLHIDQGKGRQRPHGDVEDIGYRRIVKDPAGDIETGRQAARQMIAAGWLPSELDDEETQAYVRQLANRIAIHSDLKVPLHVTVTESDELRALALPGGYIYLNSGVLLAAKSESELACVLSREIARIAARHSARASKRSLFSKMFLPVAQIATGMFTPGLNPAAYYGIGYGLQGINGVMDHLMDGAVEKYQKEADQLGAQYAWKAGFDPRGSLDFLEALEGNATADFFPDKPALRLRLLNLFSEVEYLGPPTNRVLDSPEFQQTRDRLRRR